MVRSYQQEHHRTPTTQQNGGEALVIKLSSCHIQW